jgi:hypothetical protein
MKTANLKLIGILGILLALGTSACATDDQDPTGDTVEDPADESAIPGDDLNQGPNLPEETAGVRSAVVNVPSNYVYDPSRGSLHDYCTHSPDEFPNPAGANANFRGPCARHDMCLGAHTASQTCNNRLWSDLVTNCKHWYSAINPVRYACFDTARVYWEAVTVWTHI